MNQIWSGANLCRRRKAGILPATARAHVRPPLLTGGV